MKALKGKLATKILKDVMGAKQLHEFIRSGKDSATIEMSTGERFIITNNKENLNGNT